MVPSRAMTPHTRQSSPRACAASRGARPAIESAAGGLVRADGAASDRFTLVDWLHRECLMFILPDVDSRRSHLLAGMALQRAWLTAMPAGWSPR